MAQPPATPKPPAARKGPMTIAEIGDTLTVISRMMGRLSDISAFHDASLGMAEWLFLRQLSGTATLRAGIMAQRLGVSPPRSTQILKELEKRALITVTPAAEDSRAKNLALTARGKTQLAALDGAITGALSEQLAARPMALRIAAAFAHGVLKDVPAVKKVPAAA